MIILYLQMLQICILCENEDTTTVQYRHSTTVALQRDKEPEQPADSASNRILDVTLAYNNSFGGGEFCGDYM